MKLIIKERGKPLPKCKICGSTENLQTHHISYEPEITITVCARCHSQFHPKHGTGVPIGWVKLTKEELEKFKEMCKAGASLNELMKEFNISHITVYNYKKKIKLGQIKHNNQGGFYLLRIRDQTYKELLKIKVDEGHTSFDSVIKSLLRNHSEIRRIEK